MSPDSDVVCESDLVARLHRLGAGSITPQVAERHLSAMRAQVPVRRRRRGLMLAGAAGAGFLLGSTSLAAAGVLPAPAQSAVHQTLEHIGIDVPAAGRDTASTSHAPRATRAAAASLRRQDDAAGRGRDRPGARPEPRSRARQAGGPASGRGSASSVPDGGSSPPRPVDPVQTHTPPPATIGAGNGTGDRQAPVADHPQPQPHPRPHPHPQAGPASSSDGPDGPPGSGAPPTPSVAGGSATPHGAHPPATANPVALPLGPAGPPAVDASESD